MKIKEIAIIIDGLLYVKKLNNLGITSYVHEDCLPGRTTNMGDPIDGDHLNGASVFKAISHSPIDLILVMLGPMT